jgi:hypothetical protein
MRKLVTLSAAVAIVGSLVGGPAAPAGAGGDASLVVEKVVVGPVPAGTTFTIDLDCGTVPNEGTTTVTFDEDGNPQPAGSNVFTWGPVLGAAFECTPTEQPPGGATVAYSCTDSSQATSCGDTGPQPEPIVVAVSGTGSATVTISSSFPEPPPATTTATVPAPTIGVSPTFTG